jgi:hypothetical protein
MYIAARAGPIALPIILTKVAIPREMPVYSFGVASIITFIAPIAAKDNPVARTPRLIEMAMGLSWKNTSPKKLAVMIEVPTITGLKEPSLDIMKPDVGPNTKNTNANGS